MNPLRFIRSPVNKNKMNELFRYAFSSRNYRLLAKKILEKNCPVVLAVSHGDIATAIGGTEMAMRSEASVFIKNNFTYVSIAISQICQDKKSITVTVNLNHWGIIDQSELSEFVGIINKKIKCLHIHHLLNWNKEILENAIKITNPIFGRFFAHDYFISCQHPNLLYNDKEFCHSPPVNSTQCAVCRFGATRSDHLMSVRKIIETLKIRSDHFSVVSPSKVCADIWIKEHPKLLPFSHVVPHKLITKSNKTLTQNSINHLQKSKKLRIAYLGYTAAIKGFWTWWEFARDNELNKLYDFYHLGAAGMHDDCIKEIPVSFVSDGPDAMLLALKKHQIDVAMLLSTVPETFSFTCTEAIEAGVFVVTSKKSGNIAAMTAEHDAGIVMDSNEHVLNVLKNFTSFEAMVHNWKTGRASLSVTWNATTAINTVNHIQPGKTAP